MKELILRIKAVLHRTKGSTDTSIISYRDIRMNLGSREVFVEDLPERLAVMDKGMGIAPKELEQITNKFYRVQKNSWDNSMGLGLAIVSYILKLHHSKLNIKSEVGVGSTFSFDIQPLIEAIPLKK